MDYNKFPYYFALIILFFANLNFAQQLNWERLQTPTNNVLRKLSFVDSLNGWAAGFDGTIIHTSNGGDSWEIQNSTVTSFITDIHFVNSNTGFAITIQVTPPFGSKILRTNNSGSTWIAENFPDTNAILNTIFFFDSLSGYVGGSIIAKTTDGGISWIESKIDSSFISDLPVLNFNFYNQQFGYACGGFIDFAGVIWRTTNSGNNWSAIGISPDQIFDIFLFDSLNAISLSGDPEGLFEIQKNTTTDAGLSWMTENLPFFGLSFRIDFRTELEGWAASGFKFFFTSDKGNSWVEKQTPDSSIIFDLTFTDSLKGYAVGENGVILKYAPTPTNIDLSNEIVPENFILFQNYPNPFNSSTKISWQIPFGSWQSLKIYDVLGNEIATLVDEFKPAGEHEVEFNSQSGLSFRFARNLTSGIYFYQLIAGNPESGSGQSFVETKKMILLK